MIRLKPHHLPPLVASMVTLILGWGMLLAEDAGDLVLVFLGIVGVLALLAPLGLPALWSWALLKGRPFSLVGMMGLLTLLVSVIFFPGQAGWHLATYLLMGLAAAFGLMGRWHPGLVLGVMAAIMVPVVLATTDMGELDELFALQKQQTLEARREMLLAGQVQGDAPPALAVEEQALDDLFATLRRLVPGLLACGTLFQVALNFGLIWILAGRLGPRDDLRGLPSFGAWRFPFALVWLLAAGVALMIASLSFRVPVWPDAGPNLVLVAVGLLGIQGAAVQWRMSPRNLPLLVRVLLLFMAGFLFLPLVLLGLADQWLDFRKLDEGGPEDRDDNGGENDAPAGKQGG